MIKALICSKRYSKLKEKVDFLWLYAVLNLTAHCNENAGRKKSVGLITKKKNNFARAVLYISFCHCVARIQRETSKNFLVTRVLEEILGTLRSEDGYGRENVAEKENSCSFNLHRDYSNSLAFSNVGEPS